MKVTSYTSQSLEDLKKSGKCYHLTKGAGHSDTIAQIV